MTNQQWSANEMLKLYGHPFSSYTWKARIALEASGNPYELLIVDAEHPDNVDFVQRSGPMGKFPVLADGDMVLFEATAIIEYLHRHHPGRTELMPKDEEAAAGVRLLDRVFDNYVMGHMQIVVDEHIRSADQPDQARMAEAREKLLRTYRWLEGWLAGYPLSPRVTLIECAAAPSLFYADWVLPIPDEMPFLQAYRAHLLTLPSVKVCVEDARPFRSYFPPGAPDRD